MSKLTQRESVFVATMNVLADAGISYDEGSTPVLEIVTKDMRSSIIGMVTQSIISGETVLSDEARAKFDTETKVRSYVCGLVNNWHRKDPRLNGNTKYVAKNPGSRQGAGDEQLKALKALRAVKAGDAEALKSIDAAIADRQAELAQAKAPTLSDEQLAMIPEDIRKKLGM